MLHRLWRTHNSPSLLLNLRWGYRFSRLPPQCWILSLLISDHFSIIPPHWLNYVFLQLGTQTTLQESLLIQWSMVTLPWQTDTTTQKRTWRMVRVTRTRNFRWRHRNVKKAEEPYLTPRSPPQTPVGDRRRRSASWWSVLAASASRCSARPASSGTCRGKSWSCRDSTPTGRIRRAWASSCSATPSQTQRKFLRGR